MDRPTTPRRTPYQIYCSTFSCSTLSASGRWTFIRGPPIGWAAERHGRERPQWPGDELGVRRPRPAVHREVTDRADGGQHAVLHVGHRQPVVDSDRYKIDAEFQRPVPGHRPGERGDQFGNRGFKGCFDQPLRPAGPVDRVTGDGRRGDRLQDQRPVQCSRRSHPDRPATTGDEQARHPPLKRIDFSSNLAGERTSVTRAANLAGTQIVATPRPGAIAPDS